MIELRSHNTTAGIEKGELISFVADGHQFIHQKGSPGWGSSDTEMFPIIGPLDQVGFSVKTPKGDAFQDQHGLLRRMPYGMVSLGGNSAKFIKEYKAGSPIRNSKYPEKSTLPLMYWRYDFVFEKSFSLKEDSLEITFRINGEQGMPFMLGYHPAFKLYSKNPIIRTMDRKIPLRKVLSAGSRALQVADCNSITLRDTKELTLETEGFGHFMCWTEVKNMVCVEPITFYPYDVEQQELHKGFRTLEGTAEFKVVLRPEV